MDLKWSKGYDYYYYCGPRISDGPVFKSTNDGKNEIKERLSIL